MPVGVKTPPELAQQVVALAKEGKSRREVMAATGVGRDAASRIVQDAGVEWARTGAGSSGTPEAMARARGVQSEYARNRRALIADRILTEQERTLDLMEKCLVARDRMQLSQALSHQAKAYADITQADVSAAPDLAHIGSMFDTLLLGIRSRPQPVVPPGQGIFEQ